MINIQSFDKYIYLKVKLAANFHSYYLKLRIFANKAVQSG